MILIILIINSKFYLFRKIVRNSFKINFLTKYYIKAVSCLLLDKNKIQKI